MSEPEPATASITERLVAARNAALDGGRPEAVAKQHGRGSFTARERIDQLLDPGSFVEYGLLAAPSDATLDGPADGIVTGLGRLGGRPTVVVSYDYTVFGASQGTVSLTKIDRILELAHELGAPAVLFVEGGGARAQEIGMTYVRGANIFVRLGQLSGHVPIVGVVAGPAFAGHANVLSLCDIVIATEAATMGLAGPPVVEGALGRRLTPQEIGPIQLHERTGVIDLLVPDEAAAIEAAKSYLSFFGERQTSGHKEPQGRRAIGDIVPESARRAYDCREVVTAIVDGDSAFELRPKFAKNLVTMFARLGGRTVGVIANQPMIQAGAIDAPAANKMARFIELCDAFDLPLLFVVDTPGFMVGPESEETGLIRHSARVVTALSNARVPLLTVVVRKAYGLGYYVMGSQPFKPLAFIAWPTAEFGAMGLEGAANILSRDDMKDTVTGQRDSVSDKVQALRDAHTVEVAARHFVVDDLLPPEDTRPLLLNVLGCLPAPAARHTRIRPVPTW
jgi:acetyl-CoA carboxylase carboxyltransferase component